MNKRKKKIYLTQILFLVSGLIILFYTYKDNKTEMIKEKNSEINQQNFLPQEAENKNSESGDTFYNIKYSGIDLAGNRYILKAEKATTDKSNNEIVMMYSVNAVFYFKDETELKIFSKEGIYNNKTLDITFTKEVEAKYANNRLFSQKAEYSNSNNHVLISNNVIIESEKGNMFADKLFFDIEKKTLNISSLNDGKINANINVK